MENKVMLLMKDEDVGYRIKSGVEQSGYAVTWHQGADAAMQDLNVSPVHLVLLGTDLPDVASTEWLQRLEKPASFPVIVMLREWNTDEVVAAFTAGANDVVRISVPLAELVARTTHLISLFHRIEDGGLTEVSYEDLRIELKSRKVFREGETVKLTPKEYDLLLFLAKRAGKVCGRDMILQQVWGYDFATGTNVVDVYIRHLRKKIDRGRAHKLLHTVRGTGYMLQ
ncbi:winged-helix domain-containing protein [Paenibacillus puldeungensis]|uniref:Winged-helix domain-containing protein n=1 Tax=Paenibacillus puldeungensis TaxID=696536 RepID=A0ABW3RVG6_9BACL